MGEMRPARRSAPAATRWNRLEQSEDGARLLPTPTCRPSVGVRRDRWAPVGSSDVLEALEEAFSPATRTASTCAGLVRPTLLLIDGREQKPVDYRRACA